MAFWLCNCVINRSLKTPKYTWKQYLVTIFQHDMVNLQQNVRSLFSSNVVNVNAIFSFLMQMFLFFQMHTDTVSSNFDNSPFSTFRLDFNMILKKYILMRMMKPDMCWFYWSNLTKYNGIATPGLKPNLLCKTNSLGVQGCLVFVNVIYWTDF